MLAPVIEDAEIEAFVSRRLENVEGENISATALFNAWVVYIHYPGLEGGLRGPRD